MQVIAKREIKNQAFLGFVPLDCRKLASDGLDQYIALLARGCKEVLPTLLSSVFTVTSFMPFSRPSLMSPPWFWNHFR